MLSRMGFTVSFKAQVFHWSDIRSRVRDFFGFHSRILWIILYPVRSEAFSGSLGLSGKIFQLLGKKRGFYIELGANNGFTQSNTLWLEMFSGWRGVLIEPIEVSYEECLKNRSLKRNSIVRAACVSHTYSDDTITLSLFDRDKFTRLWASPLGIESTVSDPLGHGRANSPEKSHQDFKLEVVPARTLTSILDEVEAPREIDFLSLDVEGGELEVLKGIDFSRYRIEWLCVETRDFSGVEKLLAPHGFVLADQPTHHDYIFQQSG